MQNYYPNIGNTTLLYINISGGETGADDICPLSRLLTLPQVRRKKGRKIATKKVIFLRDSQLRGGRRGKGVVH